MKTFVGAAGIVAANASTLKLTWSDCGDSSTHAKITSFQPPTTTSGTKTVMTGAGSIDADVPGATFDLEMKTAAGTVSCKGDASASKTCNLPLGTGSLTFEAMTFPIKKGSTSVSVDLSLSALLPGALATTDTRVTMTGTDGSKLFCMDIKSAPAAADSSRTHADLFAEFVSDHRREYSSEADKAHRFDVFKENMKFIEETNAKQLSYTLGVTPFADLTFEEFRTKFVGGFVPMDVENTTVFTKPEGFVMEDDVDWVKNGAVTPVKNQGQCGSCWTFSTTGALEGALYVARKKLVSLSEQEIVSCDAGILGGHGCGGGNPLQAMGWVKSNGLCSEADGPYKCLDQTSSDCKSETCKKSSCTAVLKAAGWFSAGDVTAASSVGSTVGDLEAAVARQPVSVAIEADQPAFQHYKSGVLTDDACGQTLDHAVLAVGYGTDKGQKYWKVKNSWSATWGEAGYIRMARGKTADYGECGIRHMAAYPTVKVAEESVVV